MPKKPQHKLQPQDSDMNFTRLNEVLRFGAEEARPLVWGTPATEQAAQLAFAAIHSNDNTPLAALADLMGEYRHPGEDIVRKAISDPSYEYSGDDQFREGFPNKWDSARVNPKGFLSSSTYTAAPHMHLILPTAKVTGEPKTNSAVMVLHYHNHPTGHFFNLEVHGTDENNNRLCRQFMIPTTSEEVHHFANEWEKVGPIESDDADDIRRAAAMPMQPEQFARNLNDYLSHSDNLLRTLRDSHPEELMNTSGQSDLRHITADALGEDGREEEANLLRSTDPIGIHHGKVWSGNVKNIPHNSRASIQGAMETTPHASWEHVGHTLADDYRLSDVDPKVVAKMHADYQTFLGDNKLDPTQISEHHFHLSRNDLGGFDEAHHFYGEKKADKLHAAAQKFGELHLVPTDRTRQPSAQHSVTGIAGNEHGITGLL